MSDLVERLRDGTGDGLRAWDWMREAADRIEELEQKVGLTRMCLNCGRIVSATHDRAQPGPDCPSPDACTFDVTPAEAWQVWQDRYYDLRARIEALERELEDTIKAQNECAIIAVKAVRRVALEEAEKIAESKMYVGEATDVTAYEIAAAIRKLMEKEE